MKGRTEDRLEIARAKENFWKRFREKKEEDMEEEEMKAWNPIKEGITTLEENGNWIKEEMRTEKRKEITEAKDRMSVAKGGEKPEEELRQGDEGLGRERNHH